MLGTYIFLEIMFWLGVIQTWNNKGKATESVIVNGADHELTKMYLARKDTWSIVALGAFVIQIAMILF